VVRLGDALFLHGSLPISDLEGIGKARSNASIWSDMTPLMPWLEAGVTASDVGVSSIEEWLISLNEFSMSRVKDWRQSSASPSELWSTVGGYHHAAQPFSALLQYGLGWLPDGSRNPSIVYSSWCTDGMPRKFFPNASKADRRFVSHATEFFERTGVRLICCGHQPQGDVPTVIRFNTSTQNPSYVLCCDTSYSGDVLWYNLPTDERPRFNRGRETSRSGRGLHAVTEVVIQQCELTGRILEVSFQGTLSDGSRYEAEPLQFGEHDAADLPLPVGTITPSALAPIAGPVRREPRWWTRAALKGGSFLVCSGEGFIVWNRIIRP
jgi:hypothetical protein